jgi:predicted site-specific integrase-resolvase
MSENIRQGTGMKHLNRRGETAVASTDIGNPAHVNRKAILDSDLSSSFEKRDLQRDIKAQGTSHLNRKSEDEIVSTSIGSLAHRDKKGNIATD